MTAPAGPRLTAYAYVYSHGLMDRYGALEWLFEIGRRAAGAARWQGIVPEQVWEGGGFEWYWVHTWPEEIWAGVIDQLEREAKTAFADTATAQQDSAGYTTAQVSEQNPYGQQVPYGYQPDYSEPPF